MAQANKFHDYYKELGISINATPEEIKAAYRSLVKKYHPDAHQDVDEITLKRMTEKMKLINEAWDVLSNPDEKKNYDYKYRLYLSRRLEQEKSKVVRSAQQASNVGNNPKTTESRRPSYSAPQWDENGYHRKQDSSKTSSKSQETTTDKSYWAKLRRMYREVRKEEKKNSFSKRHRELTEDLKDSFIGDPNKSFRDKLVLYTTIGTFNIFHEVFYQLAKLGKIGSEPFPKFVIRNRKLAGTILAGTVLFSCFGNNASAKQAETPVTDSQESAVEMASEETLVIELFKKHTLDYGDSLWSIATNANTSVDELKRLNNLNDSKIYAGDTLKVIYKISEYDIEYYTETIEVQGKSLSEIAYIYETNVETLLVLNPDGIEKTKDGYLILSDTLVVPNFISKAEYDLIKSNKAYN